MKSQQKTTITLAMIWIGAMALASTPEWVRAARDFISGSTGHNSAATPNASASGGNRLS